MKHNLKELDQFFDAARNESPLMDDDAFASIIQKADAVPTEVITSPTSRIMSAFKHQGGMTMTGLGLTALTGILVTGYYLNGSEADVQQTAKPQMASVASVVPVADHAVAAPEAVKPATIEAAPTAPKYTLKAIASIEETTDPYRFRHAISTDSLWSALKVEQIKPIEVTAEEIDKLGVNDAGEGKVFVIHEMKDGGVRMKMSFPPTGMDAAYDFSMNNADKPKDGVTSIMPTMITDAKGKKLAFFFSSATSDKSINIQSASFSQRHGDGDANGNVPNVQMNINIAETNGDEELSRDEAIEMEINDLPHGLPQELHELHQLHELPHGMKFDFNHDDFNMDSLVAKHGGMARMMKVFTTDSNFSKDFDFKFDFSELTKNSAAAKMMMKFGQDTSNFNFKFSMDSNMLNIDADALSKEGVQLERHAVALQLNADSLRTMIMRELGNLNMDSLRGGMKLLRKELKNLRIDSVRGMRGMKLRQLPDNGRMHLPVPPRVRELNLPIVRVEVEKINNLVPIQIKAIDPSVKYNQNGLIFWYDRDAKFAEKAPTTLVERIDKNLPLVNEKAQKDKASVSSASVISEPMVYPNPSPGRTTFKYTLAEPRAVSIAIHDLLGKQVKLISELVPKTSGEFEQELDLSSLEAGVYLLIMVTDAGEQITQRVVLEK